MTLVHQVGLNKPNQRAFIWCGPAAALFWGIGFWAFAGFVPPPSPGSSAQQIASMYQHHTNGIRFGLVLTCIGSALFTPFLTVISLQMRRSEGRSAPLAYAQLALGAVFVLEFIFPAMVLQAAAFRPNRSPELIQVINDIGWLLFVGVVTTAVIEWIIIGVCILQDRGTEPVFPRWAGYFNIWVGLLFFPGCLIGFFKDGPLAWNGLFTWWIPATAFGLWMGVMTWLLLVAVGNEQAYHGPVPGGTFESGSTSERARVDLLEAQTATLRQELKALEVQLQPK